MLNDSRYSIIDTIGLLNDFEHSQATRFNSELLEHKYQIYGGELIGYFEPKKFPAFPVSA